MINIVRHYLELFLFSCFIFLFKLLGVDRAADLGEFICRIFGPYLPASKVATTNMQTVLGYDKQKAEQELISLWRNYGRYIGEFAFAGNLSKAELNERIEIVGIENIKHLKENDQPFILALAHMANWDFLIGHIDELFPRWAIIYRQANNKIVDKRILANRARSVAEMIPKGKSGVRQLLRAIKARKSLGFLVDQKMNEGIKVPFLGKDAMTADAIAKLSLQHSYPIVPCQIIRKKDNGVLTSRFKVIIHPQLPKPDCSLPLEKQIYTTMLRVNSIVESWVLQNPDQWFWFHNRWPSTIMTNNSNEN